MSNEDAQKRAKQVAKILDERAAEIQKKVRSELDPFLKGIQVADSTSRKFSIFKESFLEFRDKYESKKKFFQAVMTVENVVVPSTRVGELYTLFLYLGAVESIGNTVVDVLVMLLVANEIDFHIECRHATPRIKHAVSIRDLEEERIPLTVKLNFLRDNGISEIARIMDSQLRNDIAHLKFQVKENKIYIRNKSADEILLLSLTDLWAGIEYAAGFLHGSAVKMGIVAKQEKKKKGSE